MQNITGNNYSNLSKSTKIIEKIMEKNDHYVESNVENNVNRNKNMTHREYIV